MYKDSVGTMRKYHGFYTSNINGFTIFELLIAMTISLSVMAAIYQLFYSQNRSYTKQDQIIETQQNLRAVTTVLGKDLQMAGYDPEGRANAGIVTTFPPPHDIFDIDYQLDRNIIGFTLDSNGDSDINPQDNEMIAYRLNNKSLERYDSDKSEWNILSNNIDALDFVFLDQDGNRTFDIDKFKAVEVTILARTNKKDSKFVNEVTYKNRHGDPLCSSCSGDKYHRRLISITLQFRNFNL